MATNNNDPKLQPLHKTLHALKEIRSSLLPFLKLLRDDDDIKKTAEKKRTNNSAGDGSSNSSENKTLPKQHQQQRKQLTPHKRAEAEAAVALAIGTLRIMGGRLKGLDRGRKKGDPLRKELDQIRGLLISLRKIEGEEEKKQKNNVSPEEEAAAKTIEGVSDNTISDNNNSKRRSDIAADIKKKKKQKTSK